MKVKIYRADKKETVEVDAFKTASKYLVVHKRLSGGEEVTHRKGGKKKTYKVPVSWVITHLPTSRKIASGRTKGNATELANRLADLDWNFSGDSKARKFKVPAGLSDKVALIFGQARRDGIMENEIERSISIVPIVKRLNDCINSM